MVIEAGAALLEAFEHVPFVGPAAFLIGAVVRASMEAVVLREDAMAFAEVSRRVERAMLKAHHLECQREPVEKVIDGGIVDIGKEIGIKGTRSKSKV